MTLSAELMEILVCPACHSKLNLKEEKLICTNASCGLRYPIRNGIPVMLIDEAKK